MRCPGWNLGLPQAPAAQLLTKLSVPPAPTRNCETYVMEYQAAVRKDELFAFHKTGLVDSASVMGLVPEPHQKPEPGMVPEHCGVWAKPPHTRKVVPLITGTPSRSDTTMA